MELKLFTDLETGSGLASCIREFLWKNEVQGTMSEKKSFFSTLPGIITALAGLVTGVLDMEIAPGTSKVPVWAKLRAVLHPVRESSK